MRKRFLPLIAALAGLLAFVALLTARPGNEPEQRTTLSAPPAATAVAVEPAPAAETPQPEPVSPQTAAEPPAKDPGARSEAASAAGQRVQTGCGKAVPCPNRDCKDCPFNIYLK